MTVAHKLKIAPSLLSSNFAFLSQEIDRVEKAGCDLIHIDVMDGHFVPNITVGPFIVKAIRGVTKLPLDTHLMIENPEKYVEAFIKAGSDIVTVHAEACENNLGAVLDQIRSLGAKAGVSLKPATPLESIEKLLDKIDMVLLMTVNPGFGGQPFMPEVLTKIKALRQKYAKDIEVDGGINNETARLTVEAGANVLVAGTAIFGKSDVQLAIKELRCR